MFTFPVTMISGGAYVGATDNAENASGATSYTFSSMAVGTARANRLVVAVILRTSVTSITSVTIGGVSATQLVGNRTEIWSAVVPTGTTASVVVNFSGTVANCSVSLFSLYDLLSTTVHATGGTNTSSSVTSLNSTLTIPANGIVIMGMACVSGTSPQLPDVSTTVRNTTVGTVAQRSGYSIRQPQATSKAISCSWTTASVASGFSAASFR